jgi:nitrogen fixation/metabolism regulation signal transduction histidine kinase
MDTLFAAAQRIVRMLLFAAFLALGFALRRTAMLAYRVERVWAGTAQLASGELEAEFPVDGRDETAKLREGLQPHGPDARASGDARA